MFNLDILQELGKFIDKKSFYNLIITSKYHYLGFEKFIIMYYPDIDVNFLIKKNKFDIIKILHRNNIGWFSPRNFYNIIKYCDSLDILEWFYNNIHIGINKTLINYASKKNKFYYIKFLHENDISGATTNAMDYAAKNGNMEILLYLHLNRNEGCTTNSIEFAAGRGDLEMIKWFYENDKIRYTIDAVISAARNGHLHVIEWFHKNSTNLWTTDVMDTAMSFGHLKLTKWLSENRNEGFTHKAITRAARYGHLHILNIIILSDDHNFSILYKAIRGNHLHIVKWAIEKNKIDYRTNISLHIIKHSNDDISILDYLYKYELFKQEFNKNIDIMMKTAIENAYINIINYLLDKYIIYNIPYCKFTTVMSEDIINFLHEEKYFNTIKNLYTIGCCKITIGLMNKAAQYGNITLLKWGYENINDSYILNGVLDYAAKGGHIDIVIWAHKKINTSTTKAMDYAAEYGHLEIVKWIHENRKSGCTKKAMTYAAMNGHLHVVKWLYKNRTEQWDNFPLIIAADEGYLDIVKWLYKNKICVITPYAAEDVIINGHGHILEWLFQNSTDLNISKSSVQLCIHLQYLDIIEWVFENNIYQSDNDFMNVAVSNNNISAVKYLYKKNNNIYIHDLIDCAAPTGNLCMIKYLYENNIGGYTNDAINFATEMGHYDIVKWFLEIDEEIYTITAILSAVKKKHMDIFELLYNHTIKKNKYINELNECKKNISDTAMVYGNLDILKIMNNISSIQFTYDIISKSVNNGHIHIIKYLIINGLCDKYTFKIDILIQRELFDMIKLLYNYNRINISDINSLYYLQNMNWYI